MKYLDETGLRALWAKITALIPTHVRNITEEDIENWNSNGGITGDTLPVGSVVDYEGDTVPENWEKVETTEASKESRNIITAGISNTYTVSATGEYIVPLNKIHEQIGDKFTLSNGRVYVGKGVSLVKISAHAVFRSASAKSGFLNFAILKNGSEAGMSLGHNHHAAAHNIPRAIGTKVIAVKEGDYFEMQIYATASDYLNATASRTYLTVEAVPENITSTKIKKVAQSAGVVATVVNTQSESTTNTYSCNYINNSLAEIIESGSNNNGNYIKYSDGTMICFNAYTPNSQDTTYHYYSGTWTFPVEFIEMPLVTGTADSWNTAMASVKIRATATNCRVMLHFLALNTMQAVDSSCAVNLVAIGRWK